MKRNMLVVLVVAMLLMTGQAIGQPLSKATVWQEHRLEYEFSTWVDILKGVADTTATAYIQGFEGCNEWPSTWAVETWATCAVQVPNSLECQWRWKARPGGAWSSWAGADTMLAADFTTGASTHSFKRLTLPAVKPWDIEFRHRQVDGSAACSTRVYGRVYAW